MRGIPTSWIGAATGIVFGLLLVAGFVRMIFVVITSLVRWLVGVLS